MTEGFDSQKCMNHSANQLTTCIPAFHVVFLFFPFSTQQRERDNVNGGGVNENSSLLTN